MSQTGSAFVSKVLAGGFGPTVWGCGGSEWETGGRAVEIEFQGAFSGGGAGSVAAVAGDSCGGVGEVF